MNNNISILSAGTAIYEVLNEALKGKVTKVFPVAADEAVLPYVCYHRDKLDTITYKDGGNGSYMPPNVAEISVDCFSSTYKGSVILAEEVRKALDGISIRTDDGLIIRACWMCDAVEMWANDAYVQSLVFKLKA